MSKEAYKGDAKLIPVFKGESADSEEVKRFVYMFERIARDGNWSDFHQRAVLESKLEGKAKIKYFEGIGRNNDISTKERLECIESMFIRVEGIEEQENRFYKCRQLPDETVKVFRYRLESHATHFRERTGSDSQSYNNILNRQFMIGLKTEIAREVAKSGSVGYKKSMEYAILIEEGLNKYPVKTAKINVMSDQTAKEVSELKKQLAASQKQLADTNKSLKELSDTVKGVGVAAVTPAGNGALTIRICDFCGKIGHTDVDCYRKHPQKNPFYCTHCRTAGHSNSRCHYLAQGDPTSMTNVIQNQGN